MRELRGARPPRPAPEDPGRLSPDQPVWEVKGEQRKAEEGDTAGREGGRRPLGLVLALMLALGLFAAGITVGAVLAGRSREPARSATAPATSPGPSTTAAPTTAPARQVSPPACLSAVDDADAVISYLVTNVRDQRLARTLQRYRAASRECRRAR